MLRLLPALLCLLAAAPAPAAPAFELPPWQQLVFEQRNFWATARGELSLKKGVAPLFPENGAEPFVRLEIQNTVGSSIESIVVDLSPADAASIARWRLSRGRDQRLKTHQYLPERIKRQRREPAGDDSGDAGGESGWVTTGPAEVALPAAAARRVIIAPHVLFLLLPQFLEDPSSADRYLVHTDLNFYRLVATPGGAETVRADFRLDEGHVEGRRGTRVLELRAEPLPGNPEGQDFELMGLSGDIEFFVDGTTGLPLRVRGEAPRIGGAELNLVEAHSRPAPATAAPAANTP